MKTFNAMLALVLAGVLHAGAAQAELKLFVGRDTMTGAQAEAVAQMLEAQLDETVEWDMQAGEDSFSRRMMEGNAPHLAILGADAVRPWAEEGLLTALNGCEGSLNAVAEEIVGACVAEEQLFALPLKTRRYAMAVRTDCLERIRMDVLLDERMHPAWYPTQVLQVLDDLALECGVGLEMWPPDEENTLCFEAFLQGIGGRWFDENTVKAADCDLDAMENALIWTQEMISAGLIGTAKSRDEALARFLDGNTAIFIDWTPEDSLRYAKELEAGIIRLLPYPSSTGLPFAAAEVIGLLVPVRNGAEDTVQVKRAAALLASGGHVQRILGESLTGTEEMDWLTSLSVLRGGATLRALLSDALGGILSGETPAKEAAQKMIRAMSVAAP